MPQSFRRLLPAAALLAVLMLSGCQTGGKSGTAHCVLWDDPAKSGIALPDSPAARQQLENWVSQHGKNQPGILSQPAGVKPMFRLLSVSRQGKILDEVPIYSGSGTPGAQPMLSPADSDTLRACFRGGKPAAVNLAARTAAVR